MIKIGKNIYIHFTTVIFLIICVITRQTKLLLISYFTAFLHESAHCISAILIGIEPEYIAFFPFGVNLRIKSSMIYSISDEIILYMSGPLLNAILALFSQIFLIKYNIGRIFFWNNMGIFLFNLLPILPLDGAMVLKRILADKVGEWHAKKILKAFSAFLIVVLIFIEIILYLKHSFNFAIMFITVFLTANIFTNTEKYSVNLLKELIYIKNKSKKNIRTVELLLVNEDCDNFKIAENFNSSKSYVVMKRNNKGKIYDILSEEEIINSILNN